MTLNNPKLTSLLERVQGVDLLAKIPDIQECSQVLVEVERQRAI